jgi:hypothetical protein
MLSSRHMIEAAIMHQIVQEAAMGIGDILNAAAACSGSGHLLRTDGPDVLVVDSAMAPLFHHATLLAAELGVILPQVVMMTSESLVEQASAQACSRGVNPNPLVDAVTLEWLPAAGCVSHAQLL